MAVAKVLHLIDSAGMYGAERVVISLLDALKESSFPGALGCIRESVSEVPVIAREAARLGIDVEMLTMARGLSPSGIAQIAHRANDRAFRILHSHGYKPDMLLGLISHKGIKTVATVHGWSKHTASVKGRIYEFLDALALRRMDSIVAVSEAVRGDLMARGICPGSVVVIENGITTAPIEATTGGVALRGRYGIPQGAFVIGAVGRLAAVKGHEYLIDAAAAVVRRIPNLLVLIAGDGPMRDALQERIGQNGASGNIRLLGYQEQIQDFLSVIDLFVMPSLSEGLPIALLEAMAVGTPVVATAVGGIPEVVDDGANGVLVPPADSMALARAIQSIFEDDVLRARIAENGRAAMRRRYSSTKMAEGYLSLYSALVGH